MPPLVLTQGMKLILQAINPTTGAAVTGVTCSRWSIYGSPVDVSTVAGGAYNPGPFMLVPGPDSV